MKSKFLKMALIPVFALAVGIQFLPSERKFTAQTEPADTKPKLNPIFARDTTAQDTTARDTSAQNMLTPDSISSNLRFDMIIGDQLADTLFQLQKAPRVPIGSADSLKNVTDAYPDAFIGKSILVASMGQGESSPINNLIAVYKEAAALKEDSKAANVVFLVCVDPKSINAYEPDAVEQSLKSLAQARKISLVFMPVGTSPDKLWSAAEQALRTAVKTTPAPAPGLGMTP